VAAYRIHRRAFSYPQVHQTCLHCYLTVHSVTCSAADDIWGGGAEKKICITRGCSNIDIELEAEQRRFYRTKEAPFYPLGSW